jgi:hypothetical protein
MNRMGRKLGLFLPVVLLSAAGPAAAEAPAPAPPPELAPVQISTFARIVGAPQGEVAARLAADAHLRGVALRAVEAREKRRSSAKARAIGGFVLLGVGDIAGAVIIVTTPGYPDNVGSSGDARVYAGLGVALVSLGVGLAIAIPGLVDLNRAGPEERQAAAEYRRLMPPPPGAPPAGVPPPGSPPPGSPPPGTLPPGSPPPGASPPISGRGVVLPLLSFTF